MGYKLLPGHAESGQSGVYEFIDPMNEFLNQIDIGDFQLGNFGEEFDENEKKDKYAAHYSIPNPWASAYLFHNVIKHGSHVLGTKIIEIILNILNDQYNYDEFNLIRYIEPSTDSPFYLFWKMAPEFIKYDYDGIKCLYFLENKNTNEIIGGLSRTTLVWASQKYKNKFKISDLSLNSELCSYLRYIKNQNQPEQIYGMTEAVFWGYTVLRGMVNSGSPISSIEPYNEFKKGWIKKKSPGDPSNSPYFFNGKLIFDANALNNPHILGIGKHVPRNFILEVEKVKSGTKLPMNQGNYEWTLFENLFEDKWVRMVQLDTRADNEFTYKGVEYDRNNNLKSNAYLFPLKPEYFKFGFNINDIENNKINSGINRTNASSNIVQKYKNGKLSIHFSAEVIEDTRHLAIWPPFPSSVIPVYINEYNDEGFENIPMLEIYDEDGSLIPIQEVRRSDDNKNRLIKLNRIGKFPNYIRIITKERASGFLKIEPIRKKELSDKIIISLDFGSTHTTVGYKTDNNEFKLMTFENSSPIILSEEYKQKSLIYEFIPIKLLKEAPKNYNEYEKNIFNWTPFRTLWREFERNNSEFLKSGVSSLTYSPEIHILSQHLFKRNLKWSTNSHQREGYLRYLLYLIVVESEALGAKDLEIRFAYPHAFSFNEKNTMKNFYNRIKNELNRSSELKIDFINPYSEAVCTVEFFVQNHKAFDIQERYATMDIGGGTTDITFMNNKTVELEDSIKFGGEIIEDIRIGSLIELFNKCRESKQLSELPKKIKYSDYIRVWPGIHENWDGELSNFIQNNSVKIPFFRTLALFYSGLFYYLGMHLRRMNIKEPLRKVACAGGGTQYLKIVSQNQPLNKEHIYNWINHFKSMLAAGHGIDEKEYEDTEIFFTLSPKKEVAFGLLGDPSRFIKDSFNKNVFKMMGLSVYQNDKKYEWYDRLPDNEKSMELSLMNIDFTMFINFLNVYFNKININMDENFYDEVNTKFTKETISQDFKNEVSRELTLRNNLPPAAPLFFTALQVWLKSFN